MKDALLLGAGKRHADQLVDCNVTTVDINPDHCPDILHDLNVFPYPFAANSFDEVHAYEVLEHLGTQGDYRFFFRQFEELHTILRPDGLLCASVPRLESNWLWGDPGHTRVIAADSLVFLDQTQYTAQVGNTAMSDYRFCYGADFAPVRIEYHNESLYFVLRAIKPPRNDP